MDDLRKAHADLERTRLDGLVAYVEASGPYAKRGNFGYVFNTLIYDVARCQGRQPLDADAGKAFQALRDACAARLKTPARPAEPASPETSEAGVFDNPLYLFRLWEKTPKDAIFIFYAKVDGGGGSFRFPDGSGGYYHRAGENLGQYRDERSVCAVLRGYGATSAEYNLGWAPHVKCNKTGPIMKPAKLPDAGPAALPGGDLNARAQGGVSVRGADGSARPLAGAGRIPYGATVETGNDGRVSFTFPSGTTVTLGANSQARIAAPADGKQVVEVSRGEVEVERPSGRPGVDDVSIRSRDGTAVAVGTRYKVAVSERGTTYQVSEGVVRVSGAMLTRTDARFDVRGKPSFTRELDLRAGERAIAFNAGRAAPPEAGAAPPLARPDPWNDPQVQALIDEWLRSATPTVAAERPGRWRFSEWGQVVGPGTTVVGAPDHPAGWSRHQSMWAVRAKFPSLNLCTLGEFVERRIAGKDLVGCDQGGLRAGASAWLPPKPTAPPRPSGSRASDAIAGARGEVAKQLEAIAQAAPDFSGDWNCTLRIGADTSFIGPNIVKTTAGYQVTTLTSGYQGMVQAHSVRVEGGKLVIDHKFTSGVMTLTLEKRGATLFGSYRDRDEQRGVVENYPVDCLILDEEPAPAIGSRPSPGRTEGKK
jgi:hypothetical protein